MTTGWVEVGERVFVRRYAFFDQNIVVVLGREEALVLDTRTTSAQAREILDDLRELGSPPVGIVVNSHGHFDHAFGNRVFRPAPIWGHERCASMLRAEGERMRAEAAEEAPDLRDDVAEVVIDPPDRTFREQATICLDDGREVSLRYLGRGHTDNDVVMGIDGTDVVCAGDLVENGATPYFLDGYPMDWPATVEALLTLVGPSTVVVPGHGDPAGRAFVESHLVAFRAVAGAARRVHAGEASIDDVLPLVPYPMADAREPVVRAVAQLRGELDRVGAGLARVRGDAHDPTPACLPLDDGVQRRFKRVEVHLGDPVLDAARQQVVRQACPERPPRPDRQVGTVHPEEPDPAQDEREHRRVKLGA